MRRGAVQHYHSLTAKGQKVADGIKALVDELDGRSNSA
jgi:hypothetical protein